MQGLNRTGSTNQTFREYLETQEIMLPPAPPEDPNADITASINWMRQAGDPDYEPAPMVVIPKIEMLDFEISRLTIESMEGCIKSLWEH